MKISALLAALAAMFLVAFPAYAAVAPTTYSVDFAPTLESALQVIAGLVLLVATWALNRLGKWLKAKTGVDILAKESVVRGYVDEALRNAVAFAVQNAKGHLDWAKLETREKLVAEAVGYALKAVPDGLRYFNLNEERLREMILARLNDVDQQPGTWK